MNIYIYIYNNIVCIVYYIEYYILIVFFGKNKLTYIYVDYPMKLPPFIKQTYK